MHECARATTGPQLSEMGQKRVILREASIKSRIWTKYSQMSRCFVYTKVENSFYTESRCHCVVRLSLEINLEHLLSAYSKPFVPPTRRNISNTVYETAGSGRRVLAGEHCVVARFKCRTQPGDLRGLSSVAGLPSRSVSLRRLVYFLYWAAALHRIPTYARRQDASQDHQCEFSGSSCCPRLFVAHSRFRRGNLGCPILGISDTIEPGYVHWRHRLLDEGPQCFCSGCISLHGD